MNSKRRKPDLQMALFADPGQPPARRPEPIALYRAVLYLRARRFRVYRAGSAHLIGDSLRSTRQLIAIADAERRRWASSLPRNGARA